MPILFLTKWGNQSQGIAINTDVIATITSAGNMPQACRIRFKRHEAAADIDVNETLAQIHNQLSSGEVVSTSMAMTGIDNHG